MSSPQVSTAWILYRQDGQTVRVDLDRPKVIFGRSSNCDVLLSLKGISRVHYMIERGETGWVISDLNSTNGTFVNQAAVTRQRLEDGDSITLGPPGLVPLTVEYHEEQPRGEAPDSVTFDSAEGFPPHIQASISLDELPDEEHDFTQRLRPAPGENGPHGTSRDRTQSIRLFTQLGRLLLAGGSLDTLLKKVLDLAFEHLPLQRGSIWLTDETTGMATVRAKRSTVEATAGRARVSRSIVDAALQSRQAILVSDTEQDARFAGAASIDQMNIHSAMCAPLCHDGRNRGFIYVDSFSSWMAFNEQHLEVLTAMAIFAAVGIALHDRTNNV